MFDLIRAIKTIPEKNKIIVNGWIAMIKNLFYFVFKIVVGIIFNSHLLIALAIFNLCISFVKLNCSRGLYKNKDDLKDCNTYISGGVILSVASVFYITYTLLQMVYPSNTKYHMVVAILIAFLSTVSIITSIVGLVKTRGRTMLIKEYKVANFAGAITNIVLTQIAILSFTTSANMTFYNAAISVCVGVVILGLGLFLTINGLVMRKVYTTGITKNSK